jgi:phospholipid-binding lipoprotein MlaA
MTIVKPLYRWLRRGLLLACLAAVVGCAAAPVKPEPEIPPKYPASEVLREGETYAIDVWDPWEGMNRRIYRFNYYFDKYIFLPVVNGYQFITPDFVEAGVSNFFDNLTEISNLTNTLLQGKGMGALKTTGRFLLNSTFGVAGLIDVATPVGLERQNEDFGQTLGVYGLGNGPFLVLPILGPSTVRDTGGLVVDAVVYSVMVSAIINELDMDSSDEDILKLSLAALRAIDLRSRQSFRYYRTGSPFEYELIRMLYLRARQIMVEN